MRFTTFLNRSLPLATLVMAGSLMGSTTVPTIPVDAPASSTYSPFIEGQVSDVLRQLQSQAYQLRLEADLLQSYTHGPHLTWETHAAKLNTLREHINMIGEELRFLQTVQSASAPWQKTAINRIVPTAAMIADRTEAAIGLLNDNRRHISLPVYADHVQVLHEQADLLKKSIDPFVELDKTKTKLEAIQGTLELEGDGM